MGEQVGDAPASWPLGSDRSGGLGEPDPPDPPDPPDNRQEMPESKLRLGF